MSLSDRQVNGNGYPVGYLLGVGFRDKRHFFDYVKQYAGINTTVPSVICGMIAGIHFKIEFIFVILCFYLFFPQ